VPEVPGDVLSNIAIGREPESGGVVALGESGGVACSSGLIDLVVGGSLC